MDMSERSEIANLVDKISSSDCERSFRMFFDRYYAHLFELALYYTKNQALAEEVISDVFLKVWNQRKQLNKVSNIQAYLFVAVKRQSLNTQRSIKSLPLFVHDLEHQTIVETQTPEDILFGDDMLKAISQSIENLPEKCRMVFKLVKEEGLKYKEVAHLLDISEKTVEMHIGHALKKIRLDLEFLQKEPPEFPLKTSSGSALLWLITLLFF
jgi:RNA polymerase sigma-70 factor (ECF subfamily)